jgi:hypothetical protein
MDARQYCDRMYTELLGFKQKIYEIIFEIDKIPSPLKEKISKHISILYRYLEELNDKIEDLNRLCPSDWGTSPEEIENKKRRIIEEVEQTWKNVGGSWDEG